MQPDPPPLVYAPAGPALRALPAPHPLGQPWSAFLADLFGETISPDRQLVVFGLPGPLTRWCSTLEAGAEAVQELGARGDVYFGCALQSPTAALAEEQRRAAERSCGQPTAVPSLEKTRGFAITASAIGGLWADVDVAGPRHKKQSLPPTIEAALEVVDELPHRPTSVLHTGGGLHAWWLFREPLLLDTDEERTRAGRIVYGWQQLLAAQLGKRGWELDATHDLARVLRLPGTTNKKYGRVVEVLR